MSPSDMKQGGPLFSTLRLFGEAGFSPDFSTHPIFLTSLAVLFRRRGTALPPADLALASELLRLNATVQECLSRATLIQARLEKAQGAALPAPAGFALPDRQDEMGRPVNELGVPTPQTPEIHRPLANSFESLV